MAHLFAFFCGGSGARVAETYAFCAATGLMKYDIPTHICLCDADHQNGNEATSRVTIDNYIAVQEEMYNKEGHDPANTGSFFGTPISVKQWELDGRNGFQAGRAEYRLGDLGNVGEAGLVANALFTAEEQEKDIKNLGFFAHPNVGSAIVQAAILYEQDVAGNANVQTAYKETKQEIIQQLDANDNVYVVFVGSLFGGTGAACMPTIAQDLRTYVKDYCERHGKSWDRCFHMSAIMLLPYFTIPVPQNGQTQIVDSGTFNSSTKIAMDYYFRKHPNLFETIYPIGLPTSYVQPGRAEYGGESQKNPSSLVEWVAALAICHFIDNHDVNAPIPVNSELCCASLNVQEDTNNYVLNNSSFMDVDFAVAFNHWNEFASFYALYMYPYIKLGNAGRKVPNWYHNYIAKEANSPVIDQLFAFIKSYYTGIGNLLGWGTAYQPENMLVNQDNLNKICNLIDNFGNNESMSDNKVRDASKALGAGFDIPKDRMRRRVKPRQLEEAALIENRTTGGFGQLLQFVSSIG